MEYGFLKVISKMGITTASGYRGAQIFEALGLSQELIDRRSPAPSSRLGGIGLAEIEEDVRKRHTAAFTEMAARLPDDGLVKFKRDETHGWAPTMVKAIQAASQNDDKAAYETHRELLRQQPLTTIRDLFELKAVGPAVPLDEVEPAEAIYKRFIVTAMSLGSLGPEAHSTLAIAMNRLGGRSNCGEGGEDPHWYDPAEDGDVRHNQVKQVASGRFGVTARYLSKASELEIKIAQGAKPARAASCPASR